MSTHLDIQLTTGEGALLRTLGLIQRRGFRIEALSLQTASEQPLLRVSVDGHERCPRTLTLQIERLHDVRCVKAVEPGTWQDSVSDCIQSLAGLLPLTATSHRPNAGMEASS